MHDAIGTWRLCGIEPGTAAAGLALGKGNGWIATTVPGDTYRALIVAGQLADPFVGRNEAAAAWVRDREWWWHAPLDLGPGSVDETVTLVFEGLDTFADVYLDGRLLGRADNMFRCWRFDLVDEVSGRHDLAICFHPTAAMVAGAPLPTWSSFADRITASRRTRMRKAQFGWGWDWGPDLPTIGICGPMRIERRRGAVVESVDFATIAIGEGRADVRIRVDLSEAAPVTVELITPNGVSAACGQRHGSGAIDLTVIDPQLWWTADLGTQPLYSLVVRTDASERHYRVGIRTIALDQSPDPDEPKATFFRFVLNGVPIFAKGANWIPASSFVADIGDTTYRDLLEQAVAANMNMIRVWGGGIYEPDVFFDECDRLGLLVWQDFMFACAPYPEEAAFLANVRGEASEQIRRLRHRACLAVWCGNNENQALRFFDDIAGGSETPLAGQCIYDDLLPAVLADLDPATPYRPSSPWGGPSPNSMRGGDVHNWTVWHGIPLIGDAVPDGDHDRSPAGVAYTRYAEDMGRFVSEFGIQAAPDFATLGRWLDPADLALDSVGFRDRIKDAEDKAAAMMATVTGPPDDLDDYVAFTQLTQAEGLKFGIEHYRRRKPHCSGALIWQFNDCWPCVSWSLIDYDQVAKPGLHAVRRAFAPVLASFRRDGTVCELWITNDKLEPVGDDVTVTLVALTGGVVWREVIAVSVPANASCCVWRGGVAAMGEHVLTVRSDRDRFPKNRLLLAPVKDLALDPSPGLAVSFVPDEARLRIDVSAARYALAVQLRSDDPAVRFDDGHFDLAGGERHQVIATRRDGLAVDPGSVQVTSWMDRCRR